MRLACLLFVLGIVNLASGGLVWEETSQSRAIDVREGATTFYFRFHNSGSETVDILKLRSSCSCLRLVLDKWEYAPGETGVLKAVADLNGRQGSVRRTVAVIASGQPDYSLHRLHVEMDIPKGYKLSAQRLVWRQGDASEQVCVLTNQLETSVKLAKVESLTEGFEVRLEEVREGLEYKLYVKPVDAGTPARAAIKILTESLGDSPPRTYTIHAVLQ